MTPDRRVDEGSAAEGQNVERSEGDRCSPGAELLREVEEAGGPAAAGYELAVKHSPSREVVTYRCKLRDVAGDVGAQDGYRRRPGTGRRG